METSCCGEASDSRCSSRDRTDPGYRAVPRPRAVKKAARSRPESQRRVAVDARQDPGKATSRPDADAGTRNASWDLVRPRVLLVHPDHPFAVSTAFCLQDHGLETTTARSEDDAAELLKRLTFDAAVVNWKLAPATTSDSKATALAKGADPGPEGVKLLKTIRAEHRHLPVVFVLGDNHVDVELKAMQYGAEACARRTPGDGCVESSRPCDEICAVTAETVSHARNRGVWSIVATMLAQRGVEPARLNQYTLKALAACCQAIDRDFDNAALVSAAHCGSHGHFIRTFTKDLGLPPKLFLASLRVELAKQLLPDRSLTLSMIADRVGFGSAKRMRRTFRRLIDRSPRDFR